MPVLMEGGKFYFTNIYTFRKGIISYYSATVCLFGLLVLTGPIVRPHTDYHSFLNSIYSELPPYLNAGIFIGLLILSFTLIGYYDRFIFKGYVLFNKDIYCFKKGKLIKVIKVRDAKKIEFIQLSELNYNRNYKERLNNKFVVITNKDERFEFSLYLKSKIEDFRLERAMTKINEKL